MKFKAGDKVRVKEKENIHPGYHKREDLKDYYGKILTISDIYYSGFGSPRTYNAEETGDKEWYGDMLEPIQKTDAEVMRDIIEGRNSKPLEEQVFTIKDNLGEQLKKLFEDDPVEPDHYKNGDKDLFDEWHERFYHSDKTYTGKEVFVAIMKSVAERYLRRYPNKNEEDLEKAIYCLQRLKEYEEGEPNAKN